jgi:CMP-N,N'-diacetyllegionaminic acid synthase
MNKRILWLIPARSSSKSIPNKNIKELRGMPLLAYRIKSALSIAEKEDIWISSDSEYYCELAKQYGATVPFIRPKELAEDTASSMDVVLHAIQHAESIGIKYDGVGLLEPTSPFIFANQLQDAVKILFENKKAHNIVATKESLPNSYFIQEDALFLTELANRLAAQKQLGRQVFKKEITPSAGFYISKWDEFKEFKTFYTEKTLSYIVPPENELEIDEPIDWLWAEFLMEKEIVSTNQIFEL